MQSPAVTTRNWTDLGTRVLGGGAIERSEALAVLVSHDDELLGLLHAAFLVRRHHFGRRVSLHVIRNAKSGGCTEDCAYCSQSGASASGVASYPLQGEDELLAGARSAHAIGAIRYCIVTSGRRLAPAESAGLCRAVQRIKAELPLSLCTSLGLLDADQARQLKAAGVDRYNHNLETSERFFPSICSTHTYAERRATARLAKDAGLELCSGGLLGMGETIEDRVDLAFALKDARADAIPLNFLDPRPGTALENRTRVRAADVLRTLAMFRLVHPDREIRIAGGREACLGPLQALALYPANSMFTSGYLTTPGQGYAADRRMLEVAGFEVSEITDA